MAKKVKMRIKQADGNFQEFEVITTTDAVTNPDGSKNLTDILEDMEVPVITTEQIDAAISSVFDN